MQDTELNGLAQYIKGGSLREDAYLNHPTIYDPYYAFTHILLNNYLPGEIYHPGDTSKLNDNAGSTVRAYENLFGYVPTTNELKPYQDMFANKQLGLVEVVDEMAQRAMDEAGGNGLLQMPGSASALRPTTVSLTPTGLQRSITLGSSYEYFVSSFQSPSSGMAGQAQAMTLRPEPMLANPMML